MPMCNYVFVILKNNFIHITEFSYDIELSTLCIFCRFYCDMRFLIKFTIKSYRARKISNLLEEGTLLLNLLSKENKQID